MTMIDNNIVTCDCCDINFYIDKTTGENLDLDNATPVCPSCDWAHYEDEKNSKKVVDKTKFCDTMKEQFQNYLDKR